MTIFADTAGEWNAMSTPQRSEVLKRTDLEWGLCLLPWGCFELTEREKLAEVMQQAPSEATTSGYVDTEYIPDEPEEWSDFSDYPDQEDAQGF